MAMVDTPYQDRNKRIVLISKLVRLCADCGHNTYRRPSDCQRACFACGSTDTVTVYEHEAAEYRKALRIVADVRQMQAEIDVDKVLQ